MRYLRLLIPLFVLSIPATLAAEEGDDGCCRVIARGLSVGGVAIAMGGSAGDKPLKVLPNDGSRLDADLTVCREHLVNGLLKDKKLRAEDCGHGFGLYGADVKVPADACDRVVEPASVLPPGRMEGWTTTAVFTDRNGERLAILGGPDGESYLIGPGMNLASAGAKIEGIGGESVLIARGGVDLLDGSMAPTFRSPMTGAPELTCAVVEETEAPAEEAATEAGAGTEAEAGTEAGAETEAETETGTETGTETEAEAETETETETETGAGTETEDGTPERDEGPLHACEGFVPDFIQRPLPVEVCDHPDFAGKEVTAVVEFGTDGWPRKLVSVDADDAIADVLGVAIRDWRIVPPELEGVPIRVTVTVPFVLEIPCR